MAINVDFFVFKDRTYRPEDISFGEAETYEVTINGGDKGTITTIPLRKRTATLTLRGAVEADLNSVQTERDANIVALINRNEDVETLDFGGFLVEDALLTDFTPSAPVTVEGNVIFETIELTYSSQVYS